MPSSSSAARKQFVCTPLTSSPATHWVSSSLIVLQIYFTAAASNQHFDEHPGFDCTQDRAQQHLALTHTVSPFDLLSPLTTVGNFAMAPSWNCDCCCEGFRDYTSIDIEGSLVCVSCVRQMFDKALTFEHNYPPKWSGPLHPSEFSHIFSEDYIGAYKDKEIEYNTPPNKRVYCQYDVERVRVIENGKMEIFTERCGEFIGARQRSIRDGILVFGRCGGLNCENVTCMVCEHFCKNDAEDMLQHICLGKSHANEKRARAFLGLKRGKDWQQCPSRQCGRRIELSAACNHISCQCGMGFCFICGKEADGESDHWRKAGCPRYNQPGDADVEYDDYDDDDSSSSGENDGDASQVDALENIRDLFEVGDDSGVSPLLQQTDAALDAAGASPVFQHTHTTSDTGENFGVSPPVFQHTHATLDALARRIARLGMPPELYQPIEESPALLFASQRSVGAEEEPETPGLAPIAANDAEAIASAFWEDDMSDDGHYNTSTPTPPADPIVTAEEAHIDLALWQMAIE